MISIIHNGEKSHIFRGIWTSEEYIKIAQSVSGQDGEGTIQTVRHAYKYFARSRSYSVHMPDIISIEDMALRYPKRTGREFVHCSALLSELVSLQESDIYFEDFNDPSWPPSGFKPIDNDLKTEIHSRIESNKAFYIRETPLVVSVYHIHEVLSEHFYYSMSLQTNSTVITYTKKEGKLRLYKNIPTDVYLCESLKTYSKEKYKTLLDIVSRVS